MTKEGNREPVPIENEELGKTPTRAVDAHWYHHLQLQAREKELKDANEALRSEIKAYHTKEVQQTADVAMLREQLDARRLRSRIASTLLTLTSICAGFGLFLLPRTSNPGLTDSACRGSYVPAFLFAIIAFALLVFAWIFSFGPLEKRRL